VDALTINEAAQTTGWSPRMLRYIERIGLVTLRELLDGHHIALSEIGFALRLRRDRALRVAVEAWLEATPVRPPQVPASDWLRWEQEKHRKLITPTLESAA
jgi:DNA-binding transcriptional MerR regulator